MFSLPPLNATIVHANTATELFQQTVIERLWFCCELLCLGKQNNMLKNHANLSQ